MEADMYGIRRRRGALPCGGRIGCSADIYADDNWKPDLYFAQQDRQWNGTVTVGPVEQQGSQELPSAAGKPIDEVLEPDRQRP